MNFGKQKYAASDDAFAALVGAAAFFVALLPFWAPARRALMQKFHLSSESFPGWAALQFVPSMYNFENRARTEWPNSSAADQRAKEVWKPHYAIAAAVGKTGAKYLPDELAKIGMEPPVISLLSRYRGSELHTRIRIVPAEGGGLEVVYLGEEFSDD